MAKDYLIRDGFSFVESDGTVITGGDTIELPDDVAAEHLHKLVLIDPVAPESVPPTTSVPVTAVNPTVPVTLTPDPVVPTKPVVQPDPVAS